jgi:hypothetical protein
VEAGHAQRDATVGPREQRALASLRAEPVEPARRERAQEDRELPLLGLRLPRDEQVEERLGYAALDRAGRERVRDRVERCAAAPS